MKKLLIVASLAIATTVSAQMGTANALDRSCRQEIVDRCGRPGKPGTIRQCLRANASTLSEACREQLLKLRQDRLDRRGEGGWRQWQAPGGQSLSYGADPKQALDYWASKTADARPPLIVYIHGGGWSMGDKARAAGRKSAFYPAQGFAFASANYRLVPQAKPDDQARDIADAVAALRKDAGKLGFDPDHIILMGHSAGAHLVALVASDTTYLDRSGVPVSAIKGVVLLDGAGYDVAKQMRYRGNRVLPMYEAAFGRDPTVQSALSPISHTAPPNVARWLILHTDKRPDAQEQSQALATALKKAGSKVSTRSIPQSSHMSVNRDAGIADTEVSRLILDFVRR